LQFVYPIVPALLSERVVKGKATKTQKNRRIATSSIVQQPPFCLTSQQQYNSG